MVVSKNARSAWVQHHKNRVQPSQKYSNSYGGGGGYNIEMYVFLLVFSVQNYEYSYIKQIFHIM